MSQWPWVNLRGNRDNLIITREEDHVPRDLSHPPERLEAYKWWCGDEVCDCTQYKIERITYPKGKRFAKIEVVWEGAFMSETAYEEKSSQASRLWEYYKACRERGIRLHRKDWTEPWHGRKEL